MRGRCWWEQVLPPSGGPTQVGTTVVMFLVSLGIVHWCWPEEYEDIGFALQELIRDELNPFVIGAVFVNTWLLFVSGALQGTALQLWARERERVGRRGSIQGTEERGGAASTSEVRVQIWLGFAGTILAALIGLIGTLFGGQYCRNRPRIGQRRSRQRHCGLASTSTRKA